MASRKSQGRLGPGDLTAAFHVTTNAGAQFFTIPQDSGNGLKDGLGSTKDPCVADKRRFFNWLDNPLGRMAKDLNTSKAFLLTEAAKEGGWSFETSSKTLRTLPVGPVLLARLICQFFTQQLGDSHTEDVRILTNKLD